jgi:DNA-binding NarL/FixJ family response regulator
MNDGRGAAVSPGRPRAALAGDQPSRLIRVVLADEAPLMHLAVRSMLAAMHDFVLAASASVLAEAEQLVLRVRPELLITDIDLLGESGLGLCRWVRHASPPTRVVILTGRDEPVLAQCALAAGATGYLLKSSPPEALATCLRQAARGALVLDDRLGASRPGPALADAAAEFRLSRRERDVLDELLTGLDNRAIAGRLCISEDTVKSHVKAIFRKLGARDRAHAVALALGTAALVGGAARVSKARQQPGTAAGSRAGLARPRDSLSEQHQDHRLGSPRQHPPVALGEVALPSGAGGDLLRGRSATPGPVPAGSTDLTA